MFVFDKKNPAQIIDDFWSVLCEPLGSQNAILQPTDKKRLADFWNLFRAHL